MEQKPSIGRVIVYNNPGSKDRTYPPTQSPAIIVRVNEDGTVLAHVFTDKGSFIQPAQTRRSPVRVELADKNIDF